MLGIWAGFFVVGSLYCATPLAFTSIAQNRQWLLSPMLLALRECGSRLVARIASKSSNAKVEFVVGYGINIWHGIYMSTTLGSIATFDTCICLMALDTLHNMGMTIKVLKHVRCEEEGRRELARDAIIAMPTSEYLEAIIPATYMACVLVVYHHPNAIEVSGIRRSGVYLPPIDDISQFTLTLLAFICVDCMSLLISNIVLWNRARISLRQAWLHMHKYYGNTCACVMSVAVSLSFGNLVGASGADGSFQFDWLHRG